MGNICRSPSAEAVMKYLVEKENLENRIFIDSAGTIGYHAGEKADARMREHASKRGYKLTSVARQFRLNDFDNFDYIAVMDKENYRDITALDPKKKFEDKIFMMTDFSSNGYVEVPDPYYGGYEGFERVLDILEDSARGLLKKVKSEINEEEFRSSKIR
jgi:protein-tyrosine phosphatase